MHLNEKKKKKKIDPHACTKSNFSFSFLYNKYAIYKEDIHQFKDMRNLTETEMQLDNFT